MRAGDRWWPAGMTQRLNASSRAGYAYPWLSEKLKMAAPVSSSYRRVTVLTNPGGVQDPPNLIRRLCCAKITAAVKADTAVSR